MTMSMVMLKTNEEAMKAQMRTREATRRCEQKMKIEDAKPEESKQKEQLFRALEEAFLLHLLLEEIIYDLLSFQVNLLGLKTKDAELEKQPRSRSSLPLEGFFTRKTTSRSFSMLFT